MELPIPQTIQILAAVGVFSGIGWAINRGANARREIRKALVLFDDVVHPVARGDWVGGIERDMTREQKQHIQAAWAEKRGLVAGERKKVRDLITTDRFFPGPWWCSNVEDCMKLGYDLVHHIIGMHILLDIDHHKRNHEYLEKRHAYEESYCRLTGKRKSTR